MANSVYNMVATVQSTAPSGQPVNFRLPYVPPVLTPGVAYSFQLIPTGGTGPWAYSKLSGSFPNSGAVSSTGLITFTPNVGGDFTAYVQIQDNLGATAVRAVTFRIASGYGWLRSQPTPCTIGTAYAFQFLAADAAGSTAGFTYALVAGQGTLPSALTLSAGGLLGGTAAAATQGTWAFTVRATKAGLSIDIATHLQVYRALPTLLSGNVIIQFDPVIVGQEASGSITFNADDFGSPPLSWKVTGNALPAGVEIDNRTAKFKGKATAVTPVAFSPPSITVTDFNGASQSYNLINSGVRVGQGVVRATPNTFLVADSNGDPAETPFLAAFLGDGNLGDFVCNGTNALTGTTLSGGINTAGRDIYVNNLTSVAGGVLDMNGYDLYILGDWDVTAAPVGAVIANGKNAALLVGGNCCRWGTRGQNGTAGVNGASIIGQDGTDGGFSIAGIGGGYDGTSLLAGQGGAGSGGAVARGGKAGVTGNSSVRTPRLIHERRVYLGATTVTATDPATAIIAPLMGGTGGGGGSPGVGSGAAAGGNSGAGGGGAGTLTIRANRIITSVSTPAGVVKVCGGNGSVGLAGAANRGGGGGGSGGGGGDGCIFYGSREGPAVADFMWCDGGNGANGGAIGSGTSTAGTGGRGGQSGTAQITNVLNGDSDYVLKSLATAISTPGAAGSVGAQSRADLV